MVNFSRTLQLLMLTMALLALPGLLPAVALANGFSVNPLMVEMDVTPGRRASTTLKVKNGNESSTSFIVDTQDFAGSSTDPSAAPILLGDEVDSPISAADWLTPSVRTFTLAPGATKSFKVYVDVPSSSSGGHYAAVTVRTRSQPVGTSIRAASAIASLFFINSGSVAPPELVIKDVVVTKEGKTVIEYENEGDVAARPSAIVRYVDAVTGETVTTAKSPRQSCTYALPGARGRCVVDAPAKGDEALIQKGTVELSNDGRTAKAEVPTTWNGGWTGAVLPATGFGLALAYFLGLRPLLRRRGSSGGLPG